MFGDHFYHATMRKSVAVFGTLFNNLKVVRKDGSGGILNSQKVPLAYGPKQKFLARLDTESGFDASVALKLPRMAFEITGLTLDPTQKLQKRRQINEVHASDKTRKKAIKQWVSYDIGMSLYILAKNQDDGLQLVEQILPYFQPDYTVTIKPIDGWTTYKQDVPVILQGVNIDDQYEGDMTERRVLIYQLDFIMKMKFYGSDGTQGLIKEINIDFNNDTGGSQILEEMNLTINPTTAGPSDSYSVVTTIVNTGSSNTAGAGGSEGEQTSGETTYVLTVAAKSGYGESGNAYYYQGVQQASFTVITGGTYVWEYPAAHPLRLSTTSDGTHNGGTEYTTGVTTTNTSTTLVVDANTPTTLYYYCSIHPGMGGVITKTS
tara:strand:- start:2772 stop:3899 length:1128 start_codon:yes stop_codon:yes gene_type:complete